MKILQNIAEALWGTAALDASARTRVLRRLGRPRRRFGSAQAA